MTLLHMLCIHMLCVHSLCSQVIHFSGFEVFRISFVENYGCMGIGYKVCKTLRSDCKEGWLSPLRTLRRNIFG